MEDAPLQLALDRLAEADILLVQGLPAQLGLPFQAGTHTGSLREFAQEVLHRRIGEALHDYFAQSGSAEPELLAHHFTQAGLTESAIEW